LYLLNGAESLRAEKGEINTREVERETHPTLLRHHANQNNEPYFWGEGKVPLSQGRKGRGPAKGRRGGHTISLWNKKEEVDGSKTVRKRRKSMSSY